MDDDASTNNHAGDAAINAHSAAPIDADALTETEKSEVADDIAEQIEEDQPIHVPLGT